MNIRIKTDKPKRKIEGPSALKTKNAEEIQNGIFEKMSVSKKLRLVSDFSLFLLKLNKLNSE